MKVSTTCFCKSVSVTADGDPALMFYCWCNSCSKASSGTFATMALFPQEAVTIEGPVEESKVTDRPTGNTRLSCARCHARVSAKPMNDMPMRVVFPILTVGDGSWFKPEMHVFCEDAPPWAKPTDFKDGLPKFADLPKAFGGTDKLME
ncbi:Mss4-like protein [Hyaloraphidium curvatum]|nr:Mss4-like protein [Hyaloraphidium curvatum]